MGYNGFGPASHQTIGVSQAIIAFERWEFDGSGQLLYHGWNQDSGSTSDLRWVIEKWFWDAGGNPTRRATVSYRTNAAGVTWDGRTGYTYT